MMSLVDWGLWALRIRRPVEVTASELSVRLDRVLDRLVVQPSPVMDWELTEDFDDHPTGFRIVRKGGGAK